MSTTFADLCLHEVMESHVLIEQWFGHASSPESTLTDLLGRFAPSFSLIAPTGTRMDEGALPTLFGRLHGCRPGLRILIDELTLIHADDQSALVSFRESQEWDTGNSQRRSTALFLLNGTQAKWQHLHETWC